MPRNPSDDVSSVQADGSEGSASGTPTTTLSAPGGMILTGTVHISGGHVGPANHGAPPPVDTPDEAALLERLRERARERTRLPELFRVRGGPDAFEEVEVELSVSAEHDADGTPGPFPQAEDASCRFLRADGLPVGRFPLRALLDLPGDRWVILGIPGSGKTTCLRRLGRQIAEETRRIPLLLRIDEVGELDAILEGVDPGTPGAFWAAARRGEVAVLVDGLDEATDPVAARQALGRLSTRLGRNLIIVTSRAAGYRPLAGARDLRLCPLERPQQESLLKRWLPRSRHAEIVPTLDGLGARMRELASNPLILTLMGRLLYQGHTLPTRRVDLYRLVVDGLLTRGHDADLPGPHRFESSEEPAAVLGWLALEGFGDGRDALGRAAIHTRLSAAPELVRGALGGETPERWLGRIAAGSALLERDSGGGWSFAHWTFHEYLAATALRDEVVTRGGVEGCGLKSELDRCLTLAKEKPALWAEAFALLTGLLAGGEAEALVKRLVDGGEGYKPLLFRVLADAEGLQEETVWGVLGLAAGRGEWRKRSEVLKGLPALVGDLGVAARLLGRFGRAAEHGADLWWAHHLLVEIAAGRLGEVDEEARTETALLGARLLSEHRPAARKEALELIDTRGWWKAIPAGRFRMGSTPETDPDRYDDEQPQQEVEITCGFALLAVPVTNALYELFDPGHRADRNDFKRYGSGLLTEAQDEVPVYNVSWHEADAFAAWLGCRLPSEMEWEYACRGHQTNSTRFWSGSKDQDLYNVGWVSQNSGGHPHPVATPPKAGGPQHPWGLHDLHGNVWEWCADPWEGNYDRWKGGRRYDPASPGVIRGGCWYDGAQDARSAYRDVWILGNGDVFLGFRLVRLSPDPG